MANFRESLQKYGLDYETTLARFSYDEGLYLKCFDLFIEDVNFEALKENIRVGDLDEAFNAAHTLKGVCGNMGFDVLYKAICSVVELLRRKDQVDASYQPYLVLIEDELKKIKDLRNTL